MSSSAQKLVIVLVTLFLGGFFGYSFFTSSTQLTPVDNTPLSGQRGVKSGQDISSLVDRLKVVAIDTSLFSSPLFSFLKDVSVPILPEPQGRPNPFASIGTDSSSPSTSVSSSLPTSKSTSSSASMPTTKTTTSVSSMPTIKTTTATTTTGGTTSPAPNFPTGVPKI